MTVSRDLIDRYVEWYTAGVLNPVTCAECGTVLTAGRVRGAHHVGDFCSKRCAAVHIDEEVLARLIERQIAFSEQVIATYQARIAQCRADLGRADLRLPLTEGAA